MASIFFYYKCNKSSEFAQSLDGLTNLLHPLLSIWSILFSFLEQRDLVYFIHCCFVCDCSCHCVDCLKCLLYVELHCKVIIIVIIVIMS